MRGTMLGRRVVTSLLTGLVLPTVVFAQTAGSIAGTVRDASGAVLPGVTVAVASDALIEKVRVAQTDGAGLYKIVELRPGTYEVTFTLSGFNTVKQAGIELTTGFTATVNAELRVGDINETVTVTGESPVVDVQNSRQQVVMTRDVIDAVPSGKNFQNLAALIPGVNVGTAASTNQDVGGGAGQALQIMFIHGGRESDMQTQVDGMSTQSWTSVARSAQALSDGSFQEIVFDTSANSAEIEAGGVRINLVPREGGNRFRGNFFLSGALIGLQANNLTDSLRSVGITDISPVKRLWEVSPTIGGPIMQNKVWFSLAFKETRADTYQANSYEAVDPAAWVYQADRSKPAHIDISTRELSGRLTWQASAKNKLSTFISRNRVCQCNLFSFIQAARTEATSRAVLNNWIGQGTWTAPLTNRLLLDFGISSAPADQQFDKQPNATAPRIFDQGLGFAYRGPNPGSPYSDTYTTIWNERGALSYVTGSHALKAGFTAITGRFDQTQKTLGNVVYTALNGLPLQVTYYGNPITALNTVNANIGVFAQDQWTLQRLTLGLGLRYDHFRSGFPDQDNPPTQYVLTARSFKGMDAVIWNDLSPRVGLAYDLFGNGKTAVKASANRYVLQQGTNLATSINPVTSNNTMPRAWTDLNGDRIVQGDPFNPALNLELGPSLNLNFGRPIVSYSYDPEMANGFGVRPANWEFTAAVQQELTGRVAANVTFIRRIFENFIANDNTAIGASDYDSFCVTIPQDGRLPDAGATRCGVMSLKPESLAKASAGSIVGKTAETFGKQTEHWNGVDVTVMARLPKLLLQGGVSTGKTSQNVCEIARNAPENYFSTPALPTPVPVSPAFPLGSFAFDNCNVDTPFLTQLKLLGSYTLPYDISIAATLQSLPGPQLVANGTYTNAQVQPALGRPLSQGTSINVNLIKPGTGYGERLNQLDLRLAKQFKVGGTSLRGMFDLFNLTNGAAVTAVNTAYGATTGAAQGAAFLPTQVLAPRLVRVGVQVNF